MKLTVDLEFSDETVMGIASAANHNQKSISEWLEYCIVLHTEMFHARTAPINTPPLTGISPNFAPAAQSETIPALELAQ